MHSSNSHLLKVLAKIKQGWTWKLKFVFELKMANQKKYRNNEVSLISTLRSYPYDKRTSNCSPKRKYENEQNNKWEIFYAFFHFPIHSKSRIFILITFKVSYFSFLFYRDLIGSQQLLFYSCMKRMLFGVWFLLSNIWCQ